jgi:phosphate transport system protein
MSIHLQAELQHLNRRLQSLCTLVEDQAQAAVRALSERNRELAEAVERADPEVDRAEIEVEEECLKILALYQPVAVDLRLVVAVLKINNDLERIGDLAVNIARKAAALASAPALEVGVGVAAMWGQTRRMLHDSLDAMVRGDVALAADVRARDDEIDQMKRQFRLTIEEMIQSNPDRIDALLRLLAVVRNIERIADYATNIAEEVVYVVEGKITRHRTA